MTGEDVHGFMEIFRDVGQPDLDLILHSPGGSPEAAEQIGYEASQSSTPDGPST